MLGTSIVMIPLCNRRIAFGTNSYQLDNAEATQAGWYKSSFSRFILLHSIQTLTDPDADVPHSLGLSTSAWTATATGPADVFGHTLLAVPGAAGAALLAVGSPYFGRADDEQLRSGMVHLFEVARGQHLAPEEVGKAFGLDFLFGFSMILMLRGLRGMVSSSIIALLCLLCSLKECACSNLHFCTSPGVGYRSKTFALAPMIHSQALDIACENIIRRAFGPMVGYIQAWGRSCTSPVSQHCMTMLFCRHSILSRDGSRARSLALAFALKDGRCLFAPAR